MRRDTDDSFEPSRAFPPAVPWSPAWSAEQVIEVLEPLVLPGRAEHLHAVLSARIASVTVVMDSPYDPHNGAAVIRSADAFGLPSVHVVRRHGSFQAARRVAKGTERWVEVIEHDEPASVVDRLRQSGFELVATHPKGDLLPADLAKIPRLALVLGNEHDGISEALSAAADRSVQIPMRGFVESLNVSVSAAILLQAATLGRPGDLDPSTLRLLYARGLFRTVSRAGEVLAARLSAPSSVDR